MARMSEQAIQRAIGAYRVRDISICDLVVAQRDGDQSS